MPFDSVKDLETPFPIQLWHAISVLGQFIVLVFFYNTLDLPFVSDPSTFRQQQHQAKHFLHYLS
jgi:hypothetical protein